MFVTAPSHLSLFSAFNAWLSLLLDIPLDFQLFATQVLTTWLLLYACWRLARLSFVRNEACWGAVITTAVCLSIPVAGSSLSMMDTNITARSFSTPLTLLAIAACLESRMLSAMLLLVLVAILDPLMSIYAAGFLLLLWAARRGSTLGVYAMVFFAIGVGAATQYTQRAVVVSAAYRAAVATRPYFFLAQWQSYELA